MVEAMTTADVELGLEKTTDLKRQGPQIDSLKNRVQGLQADIEQRISNCEVNLRELRKRRDEDIHQLRLDYDNCLDRGDAVGSVRCLDKIRQARKELEDIAQQVLKSEDDVGDLERRVEEFCREVYPLIDMAAANLEIAQKQDMSARQISGTLSGSVGMHLIKLKRVIEDGRKIASKILSERVTRSSYDTKEIE